MALGHQQTKQGPDPYEAAAKIVECTRPVLDRYAGFIYLTEAEIP